MDSGSGLRDVLDVVSLNDDLILLSLRLRDGDTLEHGDLPDDLLSCKEPDEKWRRDKKRKLGGRKRHGGEGTGLTEEVSDGDRLSSLADDAVDGEMGVDGSHLVKESLQRAKRR